MNAVIVKDITKAYGREKTLAVDNISFEVREGELFGLIGPDGAGKTSIFRILTTLILPDSGQATVNGLDVRKDFKKIRNSVGYMPGRFSLYQDLTIEENLNFFATVFGTSVHENYELIKDIYVQIEPFKKRRAGKLSGGMKQKLALCCALIHKPSVLFLDEPTTGVDPVSRKEFWQMLKKLREQNITIVVSTPYMDEATLCDRVALIQNGTLLSVDTPDAIVKSFPDSLYAIKGENLYRIITALQNYPDLSGVYAFGECAHLSVKDKPEDPGNASEKFDRLNHINDFLGEAGFDNVHTSIAEPSIEDCFIRLLSSK